jgi:hypothetical protein
MGGTWYEMGGMAQTKSAWRYEVEGTRYEMGGTWYEMGGMAQTKSASGREVAKGLQASLLPRTSYILPRTFPTPTHNSSPCFIGIENWYWQHFHILSTVALAKVDGNTFDSILQCVIKNRRI